MRKNQSPGVGANAAYTREARRTAICGPHTAARLAGLIVALLTISGCHSAYVTATVSNRSASTISVVQVEYPTASFGTQSIAPGQDFKYRFKVLGSGAVKIVYTDTAQVDHKFTGPSLKEGDEGSLVIVVGTGKVDWNFKLAAR